MLELMGSYFLTILVLVTKLENKYLKNIAFAFSKLSLGVKTMKKRIDIN